jgi:hypothetical protein
MKITQEQYLEALTDDVLRDLARNPAASRAMRKEATRLLVSRQSVHTRLEDLRELVDELKRESEAHQEVVAIVESATEAPFESLSQGTIDGLKASSSENLALTASFTTASM